MLLARPHAPKTETVNDADCYLANFWRALQYAPGEVAQYADWPVNEADLHARHRWLVNQAEFRERMKTDPDYYDAKIAGWWVWGLSQWIGGGWCASLHRRQLPHLYAGRGVHRQGDHYAEFEALAARLRRVRVACGDWSRVVKPAVTFTHGITAVLLDPPYDQAEHSVKYATDSPGLSRDVREWALANGDNPLLRIALCGYAGEHQMPPDWECLPWKAQGGMAHLSNGRGLDNRHRERIWFSPHCLRATLFSHEEVA